MWNVCLFILSLFFLFEWHVVSMLLLRWFLKWCCFCDSAVFWVIFCDSVASVCRLKKKCFFFLVFIFVFVFYEDNIFFLLSGFEECIYSKSSFLVLSHWKPKPICKRRAGSRIFIIWSWTEKEKIRYGWLKQREKDREFTVNISGRRASFTNPRQHYYHRRHHLAVPIHENRQVRDVRMADIDRKAERNNVWMPNTFWVTHMNV